MLTAEQILSKHYISVTPEVAVGKAIEQMIEEKTSIILIVSDNSQLVGTLEEGTTLRAAMDSHLRQDPVSLHTCRQFASVSIEAPLDVVLDQFVLHALQFLPVIDADGHVAGVISRTDLLTAVFGSQNSMLDPYIG